MNRQFRGSAVAIVFGCLSLLDAALTPQNAANGVGFGVEIILGALAYRSRKKRLLHLVTPSRFRLLGEIVAIVPGCGAFAAFVASAFLQREVPMYASSIVNVVTPIWIILAYALAGLRPAQHESRLAE